MPQHNFLIIGLGGTGCAVIRELKKKLYTEWRTRGNRDNNGIYPDIYEFTMTLGQEKHISRIATLSIDSNQKDLDGAGQDWRVFGRRLSLTDQEKVILSHNGVNGILGNLERFSGIAPWIKGEEEFVKAITKGSAELAGCNQIRRLGRLALANGNGVSNVINGITNRLNALIKNGQTGGQIHLACSLAGGTGSGSAIDIIAQLQKFLHTEQGKYELIIHAFVTNSDVKSTNTGNFYANQYAALSELNAFRVERYKPWDITVPGSQPPSRLTLVKHTGQALEGTYKSIGLLTDTTEGGLNVPLANQTDNVAELLFQLSVRQVGDVPKELRDALTTEDRSQYPTDVTDGDRSTAFMSYGVQRLMIPEREIREKMSYSFARQYLLKVLYNNWDDSYRDSERSFAKDTFVDTRRGAWKLTKAHLWLDMVEQVKGGRPHESYDTEWRNRLGLEAARIIDDCGDKYDGRMEWLPNFDRRAEQYWKEGFRKQGVVDYFATRQDQRSRKERARDLRADVEKDLLNLCEKMDDANAPPLCHLPGIMEFLIRRINDEYAFFAEQSGLANNASKEANDKREEIRNAYNQCGKLFTEGKQRDLFTQYQEATIRHYYWRTMVWAANYGKEFCESLLEQLRDLNETVTLFRTRIGQILENFGDEYEALIKETPNGHQRDEITYLVDAAYVNQTIREKFERDQGVQERSLASIMAELAKLRGERTEFSAYLDKLPADDRGKVAGPFVDSLKQLAEDKGLEEHEILAQNDAQFNSRKLLGQNIVEKLYQDYGGNIEGGLSHFLRSLIERAMPMVSFNANESFDDLPSRGPVLRRCIFVPQCLSVPDKFKDELLKTIEGMTGGGGKCAQVETEVKAVPEGINPTELVIISVAFFFPARCTNVVQGLKEKYENRLRNNDPKEALRAYFEVHTESHNPRLPDLMKPSMEQVRADNLGLVMLATAMGLMVLPAGEEEALFGETDDFGRVLDKVESGMMVGAEQRRIASESESRFGRAVTLETVVLYQRYFTHFRETALPNLKKKVSANLSAGDSDLKKIDERLRNMAGEAFLLSGKKEKDERYGQFQTQAKVAMGLAQAFADRSAL